MAIIRLVLQTPVAQPPPVEPAQQLLASANLSRPYFPGRQLPFAILLQIVVLLTVILTSILGYPIGEPRIPEYLTKIERKMPKVVIYLPLVGGGNSGMFFPFAKPPEPEKRSSAIRTPRRKGLSYPGPQPIVSDVPNPTNPIQTILQPELEKPPSLQPLLPLPNIVQMADNRADKHLKFPEPAIRPPEPVKPVEPKLPEPPSEQPDVKAYVPTLPLLNVDKVKIEQPKLVLPELQPPPPEPEPPPKQEAKVAENAPAAIESAKTEAASQEDEAKEPPPPAAAKAAEEHSLLALSPMPADQPAKVPYGEARGRFAISPEPNLATSETEPGSRTGSTNPIEEKDSQKTILGSEGAKTETAAQGNPGPVKESKPGSQPGTGSGTGSGPGSGAGSGPGKGPFSGITIVGGMPDPGTPVKPSVVKRARRPLQTSYGLTIVSTETSGGGLPYFDVFSHDQVYTVYLDMRRTELEMTPKWILEFAVLSGSAYQVNPAKVPGRSQQGLVLPFPTFKDQPALPVDLIRKYSGKMVIVYGVVNTQGKMEQIAVKQSPDPLFNEPVTSVLSKWTFRPARLNGQIVPVKLLMGIPLWSPENP